MIETANAKAVGVANTHFTDLIWNIGEHIRRRIAAGVFYVLEEFGIAMDNKTFSLNKAQRKAREAKKAGMQEPAPRVEAGRPIQGILVPQILTPVGGGLIIVMEKLKPLVDLLG